MSNCDNSSNSQLKALHARIERIDNDLIAHYAGISQLVAGLTANPVTAGSVAPSLATYNFNAAGQQALAALLNLIPGVPQFKQLQHIGAAQLVDGLGASLANTAENITASALASAASQALALTGANTLLAQATATLATAQNTFDQATATATSLVSQVTKATSASNTAATAYNTALASGAPPSTLNPLLVAKNAASSTLATASSDLKTAQSALSVAGSVLGSANSTIASARSTVASAQAAVASANKAVSDITAFIATLTDIASCNTHSSIMR